MSTIFAGQSALRIRLTCGQDISGALEQKIRFRKPDGTVGEWSAAIEDADNGILYHDISSEIDISEPGVWTFWAYVKFSDGRIGYGEAVKQRVYPEGEG